MIRLLLRAGLRRGLLGGSGPWLVVGGAALAVRVVQRLSGSIPEAVYTGALKPGEALVITHRRDTYDEVSDEDS